MSSLDLTCRYKELLDVSMYAEADPKAPTYKGAQIKRRAIKKQRSQPSSSTAGGQSDTPQSKTCSLQ